jgi:hypothetical protein
MNNTDLTKNWGWTLEFGKGSIGNRRNKQSYVKGKRIIAI